MPYNILNTTVFRSEIHAMSILLNNIEIIKGMERKLAVMSFTLTYIKILRIFFMEVNLLVMLQAVGHAILSVLKY